MEDVMSAERIIEVLPKILKDNPELKYRFYAVIEEHFSSREETNRILEEMRISREEANRRFAESDKKFKEMMAESAKRFAESDKKFEEMRVESAKRFAESDKRFEEMKINSDKKFEEMRSDMNKRFDAVDKRFDAVDKRFDAVDKRFDAVEDGLSNHKKFVDVVVGGVQRRAGRNLEDTVAGALRYALNRKDIKPESIKLRQKVVDKEGIIGKKGKEYEYDIFASNGNFIIFEVKSTPEVEDIERFGDKCELVIKEQGLDKNKVEKVLLTLQSDKQIKASCSKYGILLCPDIKK